jgi:neutral trehalase
MPKLTIIVENTYNSKELRLFERGFHKIYEIMYNNLIPPIFKIKTWFAIPGSKYPAAYLWDSSFISGAWRCWDDQIAQEILRPFLDLQREDGMCPQNIALGAYPNYSITNPPLLAFALMQAVQMNDNSLLLDHYYPYLQKYEKYLEETHNDQGLFKWLHSYESGIDNSPRFTNQSESEHYDLSHLWAIDFNVWMILHYRTMNQIAIQIGKTQDAEYYSEKSKKLEELIQNNLWDEETGLYYDFDYEKQEFVKINTIFSLFPLFIGITTTEQTTRLLDHIQNVQEYNTLIPFPTVARNDPLFIKDTWRGPVWINTAWIVLQGLFKQGTPEFAGDMAYHLVKGIYETYEKCHSFYEFYDPDSTKLTNLNRKKGNLGKKLTLGDKPIHNFCGWTALINTILIENILGYHRTHKKIEFQPNLPSNWLGCTLELTIPQYDEKITIETHTDTIINIKIVRSTETIEIQGKNHEIISSLDRNHEILIASDKNSKKRSKKR